jgi:NhaA family Na+:H+ antiporter
VPFSGVGPGTWIVLGAITIGKPVGILILVALASMVGLRRPPDIGWSELAVVGCVAGIGFTVALFFATAAFPVGELLDETKMGALLSFGAAGIALMFARIFRVGTFVRR